MLKTKTTMLAMWAPRTIQLLAQMIQLTTTIMARVKIKN